MSESVKIDIAGAMKGMEERPANICECGCADEPDENVGGWCIWCTHVYRSSRLEPETRWSWNPENHDLHLTTFCPGYPQEAKDNIIKARGVGNKGIAPKDEFPACVECGERLDRHRHGCSLE